MIKIDPEKAAPEKQSAAQAAQGDRVGAGREALQREGAPVPGLAVRGQAEHVLVMEDGAAPGQAQHQGDEQQEGKSIQQQRRTPLKRCSVTC